MAEIICGIYKIINTITGDFYIGSSKNIENRYKEHKSKYTWKRCPNNPMYQDFQKYGIDKFELQILEEAEADKLKEAEQQFIETLKPTYNNYRAKGLDIERRKEYQIEYYQQNREKCKKYRKEYYQQNREKCKEHKKKYQKEYYQQNREKCKKYRKEYYNQACFYNGETITLDALRCRFRRAGIEHPSIEAKKYLMV